MFLKGVFKDSSVFVQLLMLVVIIFGGFMIFYTASYIFLISKFGLSPKTIQEVLLHIADFPDIMRNMQFFQVVGVFIFPAIVCAWLFSDNYKTYLQIDTPIQLPVAGLAMLGMLVAIPVINWTYAMNQQMVFPAALKGLEEWMRSMEELNGQALEKMLYVRNGWDLVFNLVIVCILAAVGEEFMFRGMLQNIFSKTIRNPHIIIWAVAILFSTIHFQFYGFIPRLLLGAYLGYLVYYTRNIWIPILAHFTNNCFSLITSTIYQDTPEAAEQADAIGYGSTWWLSVASLALFVLIFAEIRKRRISDKQ
jgi:membrane protease YdiL (CAAX protease family)